MTIRFRWQWHTPAGGGDHTARALPSSQLEEQTIRPVHVSLKFIQSEHSGTFDDAMQKNRGIFRHAVGRQLQRTREGGIGILSTLPVFG